MRAGFLQIQHQRYYHLRQFSESLVAAQSVWAILYQLQKWLKPFLARTKEVIVFGIVPRYCQGDKVL